MDDPARWRVLLRSFPAPFYPPPMRGWATFDPTRTYRYTLHRRWAPGGRRCCFILLNPSTADAKLLDPTNRRVVAYARAWGFHAVETVNIFALRSTDPKGLYRHPEPVGPGTDAAIRRAARRADLVVCGWGEHGRLLDRGAAVLAMLRAARGVAPKLAHLGLTKSLQPKHPLYLRADLRPVAMLPGDA